MMFTQRFNGDGKLVTEMVNDGLRHIDATGLRELFEACRDDNAFAETITALDEHISKIHSNTDVDSFIRCHSFVALRCLLLDGNCASDRVYNTRKLGEKPVAHKFEYTAMMPFYFGFKEFGTVFLKPRN